MDRLITRLLPVVSRTFSDIDKGRHTQGFPVGRLLQTFFYGRCLYGGFTVLVQYKPRKKEDVHRGQTPSRVAFTEQVLQLCFLQKILLQIQYSCLDFDRPDSPKGTVGVTFDHVPALCVIYQRQKEACSIARCSCGMSLSSCKCLLLLLLRDLSRQNLQRRARMQLQVEASERERSGRMSHSLWINTRCLAWYAHLKKLHARAYGCLP